MRQDDFPKICDNLDDNFTRLRQGYGGQAGMLERWSVGEYRLWEGRRIAVYTPPEDGGNG